MSNSFTVTVNVNTTVLEVRTDTTGGATTGGTFSLSSGITLNANVYAGGGHGVTISLGSNANSATINGNIFGSTTGSFNGVHISGLGNIYINGTVTGGSALNAGGVQMNAAAILNVTGNVTAGTLTNNAGVNINGANATVNIVGNVTGISGTNSSGVLAATATTTNITGTVTGGSGGSANGVLNNSIGTITIVGTCVGGSVLAGAVNASTGTLIVTRAKGNGFGNGSVGLSSAVGVSASQTGATRVYEIEYGDLGQSPTSGPISFVNDTSNKALFYRPSLSKKTLVDAAASLDLPATNNVRNGTTYNFGNNTGTCVIPPASSVAFGVAVDNSTGTATLTPESIWNYLTSNIITSNSIGERLKNSATIDSVASQVITIKGS
ncbi:MAG: hypothetical protein ACKO7N_00365 [Candidatus Nitrosotenuis sp.]